MTNGLITLDQDAVRSEIEKQIALINSSRNIPMAHDHKLVGAIESVTDNVLKAELLHKALAAINDNQAMKNSTLRLEIESRIRINESQVNHAIATDKARNELFNNRALIFIAWLIPVAAGFLAIKLFESYVFATFIIIVLYGVLIALYFSQANGLAETWKAFTKNRRDL